MDRWKISEKAKKAILQGGAEELNKFGPFGIAFHRSEIATDWFRVQVVGRNGEVLAELDAYPVDPGCSLTITDIAPAFTISMRWD